MRIPISILAVPLLLSPSARAHAQAVQLPTFNFFTVNTTVSVPDGGSAFLGGVNSGSYGSSEFGTPIVGHLPGAGRLFRNGATASNLSTSRASVSATIIDLDEMDRAVLSAAAAERLARGAAGSFDPALARKADFLARNLGRPEPVVASASETNAAPSVAELAARRDAAAQRRAAEAADYFAKAQALEAEGKAGVAKIYYQMAAARATGELLASAQARLAALNSSGQVARGE